MCAHVGVHVCAYILKSKANHNTADMQIKKQMICIIIQHLGFRKEASSYLHLPLSNLIS